MAVDVKIPPMGESITGGLLAAWLVKNGDAVRKGQPLFSYETDKVTSEGTAEVDGRITISVEAGTEVLVGQVVASIEAGAAGNAPSAAPAPVAAPATPVAGPVATAPATPVAAKSGAAAEISPAVRRLSATCSSAVLCPPSAVLCSSPVVRCPSLSLSRARALLSRCWSWP